MVVILLVFAAIKFVLFGVILFRVFREDIKEWWSEQAEEHVGPPVCVYCKSAWTEPVDEGQTRWEDDDLVLVTTYECQHCRWRFWKVDRVAMLPGTTAHTSGRRTNRGDAPRS
jgi:hypothetical protein